MKRYDIRPGADCSGMNFTGADISGADYSWANLFGANFSRAYCSGANFIGANCRRVNCSGANFIGANLFGANFSRAYCSGANFAGADCSGADFSGADFSGADFSGADFSRVDCSGADFSGADFSGAILTRANFYGAILDGTCLDPNNKPNGDVTGFETDGPFIVGYRTRVCPHIGQYQDGRIYSTDRFSTSDTECHPGLYIWPDLCKAVQWAPDCEIIRVHTKAEDVHRAGNKWRCRWFAVVGTVD